MDESKKQLIDWLTKTLQQTGDFVVAQAPDIAQQMIQLGRFYCTAGVVLTCAAIALLAHCKRLIKRDDSDDVPVVVLGGGLGFLTLAFGPILFIENISAFVAPKVYILQQLGVLK